MAAVKVRTGKGKKVKFEPPEIIKTEEEVVEEEVKRFSDDSFKELNPEDLHNGYDTTVKDWLLRKGLIDQTCTMRVYRFERGERVFVKKFVDHIPDEDEVGNLYGSGRYECMLQVSDKNRKRHATSSKFTLHESYDEAVKERKMRAYKEGMGNNQSMPYPPVNNFDNMIEGISKLMVVLMPLFDRGGKSSSPDMSSFMLKNYEMMQGVMKRSILDQQQNVNDIQRMSMGVPEVMDDIQETTGLMGVVNNLAPLVEKFLPLILGGGLASKTAVGVVQAAPQYAEIIKSKRALNKMIGIIEKQHGKEAATKVLAEFKLKRPKKQKIAK